MSGRAIVIGGGHNGLVAAATLAAGGFQVTLLERREVIGGACVTEELLPGVRVSTAAYSFSLFRPEIARALDLARHGLRLRAKHPRMFAPLGDGRSLTVHADEAATVTELARIHPQDAEAYPRWNAFWDDVADAVRPMMTGPVPTMHEVEERLGPEMFRLAVAGSAAETVEEFFASDEVRGVFVGQGIIGTFAGPRTPGTAWVMSYHAFGGELVEGAGTWAYVDGGMGSVTRALESAAREAGVHVLTDAAVEQVIVEDGIARGVVLDGVEHRADVVLSNADPVRTYGSLVGLEHLSEAFAERVRSFDTTGSVIKVNLVLDELPDFASSGVPGAEPGPQHAGTIEISPSVEALERAFTDARAGSPSREPFMEVFIQTVTDDSLAPAGTHVASCFAQYAPGSVPLERWEGMREAAGDAVVGMLARYAPNVPGAIRHRQVLGPADLEARFGLTGGNIFHGEILPGQIFADRFDVRAPITGLYLCGSGAHPGGGVCGAPGWNAARAALDDLGRPFPFAG